MQFTTFLSSWGQPPVICYMWNITRVQKPKNIGSIYGHLYQVVKIRATEESSTDAAGENLPRKRTVSKTWKYQCFLTG